MVGPPGLEFNRYLSDFMGKKGGDIPSIPTNLPMAA